MTTYYFENNQKRRWFLLGGSIVLATLLVIFSLHYFASNSDLSDTTYQMRKLVTKRAAIEVDLKSENIKTPGQGLVDAYLAMIRRDGLTAHASTKLKLQTLADINLQLLTLAELHSHRTENQQFRDSLNDLRQYVLTWNNRWSNIFETYMSGGSLAGGEMPFPVNFEETLQRE